VCWVSRMNNQSAGVYIKHLYNVFACLIDMRGDSNYSLYVLVSKESYTCGPVNHDKCEGIMLAALNVSR